MKRPRYNNKRKRKRTSRFKQGYYIPVNESKYKQPQDTTMNSEKYPFMRSSWEQKFARYLDFSENIEFWSTEAFPVYYISPKDGKQHRYFIDFMFKTISGDKFLVEIKPNKQKGDPVNIAKWEQAEKYADKIGAKFLVVTEIELKKFGLL